MLVALAHMLQTPYRLAMSDTMRGPFKAQVNDLLDAMPFIHNLLAFLSGYIELAGFIIIVDNAAGQH